MTSFLDLLTATDLPWYALAFLSLVALLLLTIAVARAWAELALEWRRVLVIGILEHGVIAYAALEATGREAPLELGVLILALTLIGLVTALALLVVDQIRDTLQVPG